MRKSALAVGLVLGLTSASLMAQDGYFFANGNLGQSAFSDHYLGGSDRTVTQGALRLGYDWHGAVDYGVELGYADLGEVSRNGSYGFYDANGALRQTRFHDSLSARGWLLGGNVKYNFDSAWYLSAHAGLFESQVTRRFRAENNNFSGSQTSSRGYAGVGAGYNFSRSWSLGAGYDYYNLGDNAGHVNAYSVTAEFRF